MIIIYLDENSASSSPIFYEKPGLPEIQDDDNNENVTLSPNGTRKVKFSNAPIRVREFIFKKKEEYERFI